MSLYFPVLGGLHKDLVLLDGYVSVDSDASILSSTVHGVAVTHSGTGEYTCTISDPLGSVVTANFTMVADTAVDLVPQVKSASRTAIVMHLLSGSTPTNPGAKCGFFVHIVYKHSTLGS